MATTTRFPDPDLLFPFGVLLFIAPIPSSFLAPANIACLPAPKYPPGPALGLDELNGVSKLLHQALHFEFNQIRPFKVKAALLSVPIEAPLASRSGKGLGIVRGVRTCSFGVRAFSVGVIWGAST